MKNCVVYSIYISNKNLEKSLIHYSALYHSLTTLFEFKPKNLDVLVFYSSDALNLKTYKYLNQYNLINDFPDVKFIQTNYSEYQNHVHLHKWLTLEKISNEYDYDTIFYVDNDVFFLFDFEDIFSKYDDDNTLYCLWEGRVEHTQKLLGNVGISSGQFLFKRKVLQNIDSLFEKVIHSYNYLKLKNEKVFVGDAAKQNFVFNLLEQYAASKVFYQENVKFGSFKQKDISYGSGSFRVKIFGKETKIVSSISKMVHVMSSNLFFTLPAYLRNSYLQTLYNQNIEDNQLINPMYSSQSKYFEDTLPNVKYNFS